MKVKTAEMSGVQLDYAVAWSLDLGQPILHITSETSFVELAMKFFSPTVKWDQCAPLIEQFQMFIEPPHDVHRSMIGEDGNPKGCWETYESWHATVSTRVAEKPAKEFFGYEIPGGPYRAEGETPLIAICRAVVASKLGDEVDIPDELMEATK